MANILVADDDQQLRELIRSVLTKNGHHVTVVENGEMVINLLRKYGNRFHIIITDILMPKMEGTEAISIIKKAIPEQIIIAMSGDSVPVLPGYKNLLRAAEAGADYTLKKPFDMQALVDVVKRFT